MRSSHPAAAAPAAAATPKLGTAGCITSAGHGCVSPPLSVPCRYRHTLIVTRPRSCHATAGGPAGAPAGRCRVRRAGADGEHVDGRSCAGHGERGAARGAGRPRPGARHLCGGGRRAHQGGVPGRHGAGAAGARRGVRHRHAGRLSVDAAGAGGRGARGGQARVPPARRRPPVARVLCQRGHLHQAWPAHWHASRRGGGGWAGCGRAGSPWAWRLRQELQLVLRRRRSVQRPPACVVQTQRRPCPCPRRTTCCPQSMWVPCGTTCWTAAPYPPTNRYTRRV